MWSRYRRRASALSDQLKHKSWSSKLWIPFFKNDQKIRVGRFRWCHLHKVTNLASLALHCDTWIATYCIGLPYWHYQLVSSWYPHQLILHKVSHGDSDGQTSGPKDRTPGLPGSDKNRCDIPIFLSEEIKKNIKTVQFFFSQEIQKNVN